MCHILSQYSATCSHVYGYTIIADEQRLKTLLQFIRLYGLAYDRTCMFRCTYAQKDKADRKTHTQTQTNHLATIGLWGSVHVPCKTYYACTSYTKFHTKTLHITIIINVNMV